MAGPRGELLRLFVLGEPFPRTRIAELLPELDLDIATRSGLLDDVAGTDFLASGVDLRPVDTGSGAQWVFSDRDGSMVRVDTRPDHVLGVGQASLSLLGITPPGRTRSVLDLGTGCGIQLLSQDAERRVGQGWGQGCACGHAAEPGRMRGGRGRGRSDPWTPVGRRSPVQET